MRVSYNSNIILNSQTRTTMMTPNFYHEMELKLKSILFHTTHSYTTDDASQFLLCSVTAL